ncbi:MAG TPA: amino acid adenylation domain-containing protein [Thermoanaerobaculia bacterium]|nr:amino acid adenylation domain-containing protein [Thermoanaerobaculia bacterium]
MKLENLESVQRLSPLQEDLLFEVVTGTGGRHVRRMTLSLRGPLDAAAWRRAWESVVARHQILRTTFHWQGLERPFQVVPKQTPFPWQELDGEEPVFDVTAAPPLRLALVRDRFTWTWHRLLLDDASALRVLREAVEAYAALIEGREPRTEKGPQFKDYVPRLQKQEGMVGPFGESADWSESLQAGPLTVILNEVKDLGVGEPPAQVLRSAQDDTGTPIAVLVERTWRSFPGVKPEGDDLLAQAAHPFQTLRLLAKLRQVFGVELTPRELAEEPTVAGLARRIEQRLRAGEGNGAPPVVPMARQDRVPASFSQERLWFIDQLEPGSALYNMPAALRVTGPLDVPALARSLAEIERRHEVLRTVFTSDEGAPRQVVLPGSFRLWQVDLTELSREAREEQVLALAAEEVARPFDLARGPLWRATLLRLSPDEHAVLITLHHVVSDGWSTGVLIGELTALYGSRQLPELPVQYADFAVWQRWWLQGEALQRELDWWRGQLAGAPALLELPTDRPRPAVESHRGALQGFALPRALSERLLALSRAEGATLFMTVLAVFQALLSRWSGQLDVSVGTPIAGRNRAELEPLIGFFVNTLVLRTDIAGLGGDPTFRALLARVREGALGAQAHQDLPFDKLVAELEPERSLSHAPLFQVMLILQNVPAGELDMRGLRLTPVEAPSGVARFDLTLTLEERPEGIAGDWSYSTGLFDAATVARLGGHFERLLAAVVESPASRLSGLPFLTAAEARQILVEWNDTRAPQPGYASLHALFEAQARRTPDAAAVLQAGEALTFGELDRRANRLARELAALGAGPESRVALYLNRSSAAIVALIAAWKAGAAWLALDPEQPAARTSAILSDAAPAMVLTDRPPGTLMPPGDALVVHLETIDLRGPAEPLDLPMSRDRLAYLVYTSGSTGTPKGTLIPHGAVLNFLAAMERAVFAANAPAAASRRVSVNAPLFFDASVQQLAQGLRGHTLVLVPEDVRRDGKALRDFLEREAVDVLDCTPSQLRVLLDAGPPTPRYVLAGGEAIDPALWDRLRQLPGTRFFNVYGPTECTVNAAVRPIEADAPHPTIGRPLSNVRLYVVSPDLAPLPAGVAGELWIGGEGLMRGYLNRPDTTAEKLVPDPFAARSGSRLYRTGDLARWTAGGEVELLGRIDQQVKLRGFRIELGEIESALAGHPGVAAAAILLREDRLAACVVPAAEVSAAELRDFLRQRLPAAMVPSIWTVLDALPLTASAKVDRRALARMVPLVPDATALEPAGAAAPRTPTEELVAGVWADVLGLERVGPLDDFFALGGHSLLATRVMSRLHAIFGVDLPLRDLFEAPTAAGLAARIETALRAGSDHPALPPLRPVPRDGPGGPGDPGDPGERLPLSFAQQRLWFIDQLEPGSPLYNMIVALRLEGRLDRGALAAALTEIARRHESLRTVFRSAAGEPFQVIQPPSVFPLGLVDLSGLADRETESYRLALAEARRPFDLKRGPLWRGTLIRLREDEHVAVFILHHIVGDGWSTGRLIDEVRALYTAFAAGRPSPLPELPVQYADFAVWQRGWLQGEVLEREIAWWRERLAGAPALLELPTDRPRPAVQAGRGAIRFVELPEPMTQALHGLSLRLGSTLFMTVLAAFQALLSRWSHQRDSSIGTPIAGRGRVELEGLIGFFANTLVLRTDLESGNPGFRELVGRARQVSLDAHLHQDLPFEKLVEELAPERSLSHSPLFQTMLVLQNAARADLDLPGLTLRGYDVESGTAKFDLLLALSELGGRLAGAFQYDAALFDAATIDRLRGNFETLLAAALADPEVPVAELPLLTAAERTHLLVEWNDTGRSPLPAVRPVHELVAEQDAGRPALLWPDGAWTYGELAGRAGRLARRLRALGAGPEVVVAVCAERSPELALAMLAILESGAAYLPLDPSYPRERLAFMLEDSGAALLLAQPRFLPLLPESGAQPLDLTALTSPLNSPPLPGWEGGGAGEGGQGGEGFLHPDQAAYLVYTSGSTGTPKGMCQTHRTLSYLVGWQIGSSPGTAAARTLQFASPSFDVSVQEVLSTWCAGGALVIGPEEVRRDPERLVAVMAEWRIERIFLPFVAVQQLAEQVAGTEVPAGLREVVTAGERLQVTPEVAALFARLGDGALRNQYGPSETHVATEYALAGAPDSWEVLPPIGRPIQGTRIYLVEGFEPVPAGVTGEMLIGGAGLARGYLRRPDLTAERFVPDPFGGEAGARLYRSGDLARLRPDGELEFLGRADRQVKIRGFRVEPEEIEAVLARHPAVRESAVVAQEVRPGDRRLVAYVASSIEPPELRRFAREALPGHMVPAVFVPVDALPLTSSGKVDRQALSRLAVEGAGTLEPGETFAAPRDLIEEGLAGIWEEVLRIERPGAHDNFFDRGGHSLSATRVMARVRDAFGIDLPLRTLFEVPTIAGLAGRVSRALRREAGPAAPPLVAIPPELRPRVPLSFAQQRLWFLDQLEPGSPLYNLPAALRLDGALDAEALSHALGEIVRRHESLRTTFPAVDGEPVQRVHSWEGFSLPRVDLTGLGEEEARRLALEDAARPFDLERGPLFRPLLLRLAPETHVLLASMHHIVGDGWSTGVLVRELAALYAAFRSGLPSPLPELPLQYPDFALWQRSWLAGEVLEAELAWWREQLAGLPALLELPTDRPRPAVRGTRGAWLLGALPDELAAALRALARAHGTTLFMVLLAGFETLLSRYSGQRDLAVGMPIAGRNRVELEGLIGFLVNTLVLRADLSGAPSFAGLLRRTRDAALGAYAHQDLPFEKLVEELAPERSLAHTPLFQVLLALQNVPREALELPGLRIGSLLGDDDSAKFDLMVLLDESGTGIGGIAGSVSYATDLFDAATIDRLWGHFRNLLAAASAGPETSVAELSLLDAAELRQLLVDWNDTATPYPRQRTIPDLFAEQVALRPEAPALEWGERTLTYAELDRRARGLAHRLRSLGVGPEVRVAVCLERSPEMIVAFLATLKAGGAYVPLDLSYPWERLSWMLEDSGAPVLIADAGLLPEGALMDVPLQVVLLDDDWQDAPEPPDLPGTGPESLAYVMYTSGSTGRPKGVAVPQRAIVRLVRDTDYAQLTPDDRVAQVSNPVFDAATFEVWGALLNGGCLVGIERDIVLSPLELADALRRRRISATFLTAALFHQIAHDVPGAFATVRHLLAGGDAIEPRWARAVLESGPPERLVNGYGPTETTTFAVWHLIQAVPPGAATVPIGRPLANARLYVLDPGLAPQPAGVPGELYIGGDGVARGYHGRPDLTAERFVPDPWGEAGDRLYRTGDLVRYRRDGVVEFLGRIDRQVKIRGFRIEPGEIEAALLEYPGVKEAVVMVRQDPGAPQDSAEKRLAAYFVADLDGSLLRRHLETRLPAYMVPASFTRLEALPLTPNGKVDRAALPAPEGSRSTRSDTVFEEPETATERELAAIWAEILDADRVGAGDDFFQLGGHSLLAVRVVSRMRAAFHLDLSVRLLFDTPRLRDLAAAIDSEQLAQAGETDLTELLAELEGLSDDEALELSGGDDV